MTDLLKQMADALRTVLTTREAEAKASMSLEVATANYSRRASRVEEKAHLDALANASKAEKQARELLALFDAQAAEQAGGGEADYRRGWDDCMAIWADHMKRMNEAISKPLREGWANHAAELGARLQGLHDNMPVAHPAPAAPSDPQPKGVAHNGNDKEPRDPDSYPYLDARGDDRGQGLDSYWKWGYAAGWNDCKKHTATTRAPAPAETPAAPVQQVGELPLPPLPEWAKRDDLGGLVPSEIRSELYAYARAALAARGEKR